MYSEGLKRDRNLMVITSREILGSSKVEIRGVDDRMKMKTIEFDDFLISVDCVKMQADGRKVISSKDESWTMDRYRNMLYKIYTDIDKYIRQEFRTDHDHVIRVGPFGM